MENIENRLQAVLEKVEALKEEQKLSQEKVGKLVGVSGAIISQLRNGKYPGDVEKQVKTLEEYFSIKSEYEDT
ncbi:MAG: helix-turn-helix domain-containing protein, partial [Huintestinicola sp.]